MPKITITSVYVDDQDKALRFYTEKLGFERKTEIPLGDARWLTVVSPDDLDGIELLLEPDAHPAVGAFKQGCRRTGSRSRRSPWMTPEPSSNGCGRSGCGSPRSRWTWGR